MEQNKDQSGAAVRGEAVAEADGWKMVPVDATWKMTRPAFSFDIWRVRCDCGQEHSGGLSHNKAAQLFKSMVEAAPVSARAADAPSEPSEPTDLSLRLRETADKQPGWKPLLTAAADEIERYYGGMMAWKRTAEQKDAEWNAIFRAADALDSQPTDGGVRNG